MVKVMGRLLPASWNNLHRLLLSVAAILLFYWSHEWLSSFRDNVAASSAADAHLWRWFVAAALALLAGFLFGILARNTPPGFPYDWKPPVVIGTIPLLLAMTWPPMIWGWPGFGIGRPFWSIRSAFFNDGYAAAMWLVVGLAITSGFTYGRGRAGAG